MFIFVHLCVRLQTMPQQAGQQTPALAELICHHIKLRALHASTLD